MSGARAASGRHGPTLADASGVERARQLARALGLVYVALAAARLGAQRLTQSLEQELLRIEGRRGVMGPAHERHADHSAARNREVWTEYDWNTRGEEWSESAEWKAALVSEVLEPNVPEGGTTLEIGPGAGRWSEVLYKRADKLIVVDVTDRALELTRERLGEGPAVHYLRSNGSDLPGVPDTSVHAIWSYDVFVHIAPRDVAGYLTEIARVLRPDGKAVIHHSGERSARGWRSPMSAALFASLAGERGLEVTSQFSSWGDQRFTVPVDGSGHDVITVLRRP
jgi:ubiquinone/menaquinone biosynthesis C-methylase UbiE